eukprot:gene9669-9828_t
MRTPRRCSFLGAVLITASSVMLLLTVVIFYQSRQRQDCLPCNRPSAPVAAADLQASLPKSDYDAELLQGIKKFRAELLSKLNPRYQLPVKGFTPDDWKIFAPFANCPPDRPATRYGGQGDGSKMMCKLKERQSCIIYSLGSNGNFQFEDGMLSATPCDVHTFDCTYKGASRHARHFYHEWCVGQPDDNTGRKFRTWANITSSLGHNTVDILKMDIEGAEYSVLGEFLPQHVLPEELAIEMHVGVPANETTVPQSSPSMAPTFIHLANLGYAIHSQEINRGYPYYAAEFSFIRAAGWEAL